MDPSAVRPDRDFTGKQQLSSSISNRRCSFSNVHPSKAKTDGGGKGKGGGGGKKKGTVAVGCGQKLSVEMRTMLMTLQNIEARVVHGDTAKDASEIYPLRINTIREIINDPAKLKGRRTEIRYEPYRMARNGELCVIVYRRLIAAIDWVEHLAEAMNGLSAEDKIVLVKACFGPLTLFKCSARTAQATANENLLCLCNFAYVPRDIGKAFNDAYHLDNGLVERLLNELVSPFRRIQLTEEEVVCMSAIIVLNPMARDLSEAAADKCFQLRNRICATLYQLAKVEEKRAEFNPTTFFGNLLLFLPIIASLDSAMSENLRFAQTFSALGGIPLLTSLFGCFPLEPFTETELALEMGEIGVEEGRKPGREKEKTKETEGEKGILAGDGVTQQQQANNDNCCESHQLKEPPRKRRVGQLNSLEECEEGFRLLRAPCSFTLTEMFDDRINHECDAQ